MRQEPSSDVTQALKINPMTLHGNQMEYIERPFPDAQIFKRLFIALVLNDIVQEYPIEDLEIKYDINRGHLQNLQNTVSTFAGMMAIFCNKLGWYNLEVLIDQFQSRLEFGIQRELIDIMRIQTLNSLLARQLYDANYDAIATIAHSSPADILKVFKAAKSFEASSPRRRLQNMVWIESQRRSMTMEEISECVVKEARELVERDVGRPIDWEINESVSSASELSPNVSGDQPQFLPRTPKSINPRKKSPGKIMSRKELKKIDVEIKKSVRSTSLGEHSISIDPAMSDAPDENPIAEEVVSDTKSDSTAGSSPQRLCSGSTTPTKSSSQSSDGSTEEVICRPKVLFTPIQKVRSKRLASPSTSFEAHRRSKILKLPDSEGQTEQDLNPKMNTIPFVKSSIEPGSKFTKIAATDQIGYEKITEMWRDSRVMSVEVDTKECFVVGKKIGTNHGARNSSEACDDGIVFDGGRMKLTRLLVCFGSSEVTFVSKYQSLIELSKVLSKFLENNTEELTLITFDIMKVYRIFRECFGLPKVVLFKLKWFGVKVGHWLNDPESDPKERRDVHDLVRKYLPDFAPLSMKKKASLLYSTAFLFPLAIHINNMLVEMNMKTIFEDIETVASLVLAELEFIGMGIDVAALEQAQSSYYKIMNQLAEESEKLAGKKFNMKSPKQVSNVLYKELNLLSHCYDIIDKNPIRVEKLKAANKLPEHLKTSKEMLEKLRPFHPLPPLIAEYRKLHTTNTMATGLLQYSRKYEGEGHRVCGKIDTFHATGRISMDNPNLLSTTRTFEVTSLPEPIKIDIRKHFVAKPGYVLLSADYSQLELRLLAHFSNDPHLLQALNSGKDVFRSVAASIHDKNLEEVSDEERAQAKSICYGIVYGVGTRKLSENLSVTEEEAKEFKNVFLETYSGIDTFLETVVENCKQEAVPHIKTLVGRLRLLPLINGTSDEEARASRQAINSTIQGSASDLIKLSMVKIEKVIQACGIDARLVLEMHDELIFEVKQESLMEFAEIVSNTMEKSEYNNLPIDLKVQLTVNLKQGLNWSQMNELKLKPKG